MTVHEALSKLKYQSLIVDMEPLTKAITVINLMVSISHSRYGTETKRNSKFKFSHLYQSLIVGMEPRVAGDGDLWGGTGGYQSLIVGMELNYKGESYEKVMYQSLIVGMEQAHLVLKFILTHIYSDVNGKISKNA